MGEYADMAIEAEIEQMSNFTPPAEDKTKWQTVGGARLSLQEMETSHLRSSLDLINQRGNWRREFLGPIKAELKWRQQLADS